MKYASLVLSILFSSIMASADTVDGLYARAFGNPTAPAVIFLHGGPGANSFVFESSTAEVLAKKGYYVVLFDQRGCGRSARGTLADFTFANAVKDIRSIVTNYKLIDPIIVGHSFGGTVALRYADAYPTQYRALLLIDSPMDQVGMIANILDRCEEVYLIRKDLKKLGAIRALRAAISGGTGSRTYTMTPDLGSKLFLAAIDSGLYYPKASSPLRDSLWERMSQSVGQKLVGDSQRDPFIGFVTNEHWLSGNTLADLHRLNRKVFGMIGADDGLFNSAAVKNFERSMYLGHFDLVIDASQNLFVDRQDEFLSFFDEVVAKTAR